MTVEQWERLLATVNGEKLDALPVGFIIDSPWLPGWAGMSIMDYYTSGDRWLAANFKAVEAFPDVMFLPGFWGEYGMCTEPSAFGTKCVWHENDLPFADKIVTDITQVKEMARPNPKTDGLAPFVLNVLKNARPEIKKRGHAIKFAVARGPLNLASFLMGNTEFLMAMHTDREEAKKLLEIITNYIVEWLNLQAETFPSIEGIFLLDDIVGFIGENDFRDLAMPYLKQAFSAFDAKIKFFHNDAQGKVSAPFLPEIGVNLFNHAFEHGLQEMKDLTDNQVTLLGNIPPRDVLASGTPDDVRKAVASSLDGVADRTRIVMSCGGGMPPNTPTENIEAFIDEVRKVSA